MNDRVYWKPQPATKCEDGSTRTVYLRGYCVPFVGWMADCDTTWTCPAFVRVQGKRVRGYLSTEHNMFVATGAA